MGKNKRAAKAAWRAAAAASIAASTTSPAPSLVAPVTAHDAPAAIDRKESTPAPTQQPHEANTSNARPAPCTSSLAPHTASPSSHTAPTSPSNHPPPFAIAREAEQLPATTKRDTREARRPTAHPVHPITTPASHTHIATTHDAPAQPHVPTRTNAAANEPAGTTNDKSSTYVRTRSRATAAASHSTTTTPNNSLTPPDHAIRLSAAERESEEGSEPREDEVDTARDAHGGDPRLVRSPAFLASRPRSATVHGMPTSHDDPTTPSARERERTTRPAPATASPAPRTTTHDPHGVPASPTRVAHRHATTNEPDDRREARGADTHDPHNTSSANTSATTPRESPTQPRSPTRPYAATNEPTALAGARPGDAHGMRGTDTYPAPPSTLSASRTLTPSTPDVPAPTPNDVQSPTPGFEPGEPRAAAALFLKNVDPALLDLARIEELVASALSEGHAAGLKEGRNTGFREGLAAGQRTGTKARMSPAKSREEIDEKLLAGIVENARRLERRESRVVTHQHGLAEHERGLEEGWKEGFEQGRVHGRAEGYQDGFLDSANTVSTPRVDADVQTDEAPNAIHVNFAAQTEAALTTPCTSFSWADEAESLPIRSAPPLPAPRDFSVLRSSSRSPFGSLQRRARRSHRSDLRPSRSAFSSVPVITRHHPAGLRAGRPSIVQPSGSAVPPLPLSWDGDPRLVELSRVLQSLGWVRESSG